MQDVQNESVDSIEADIASAVEELTEVADEIEIEAEEAEDTEDAEEIEAAEEVAEEPEDPPIDPPQHWSASDKELFKKQPKDAQEWILERHKSMEADYTRSKQELSSTRRQFDAIKDALAPYANEFKAMGLDEAGAVRRLAAWDQAIRTGGREAILKLAQNYRIDMSEPESTEYVDPQVLELRKQVQTLNQMQSQQIRAAQQQNAMRITQQISDFANEKDESGNLLHPHLDQFQEDMAALISAGRANGLEDAYKKVSAWHPELAVSNAQKEPVVSIDKAEKVRKAKKAATGVKSSGSIAKKTVVTAKSSIEDDVRAALEAAM